MELTPEPSSESANTNAGAPGAAVISDSLNAANTAEWIDTMMGEGLVFELQALADLDDVALSQAVPAGPARVVLQNDLWGLWQRVDELDASSQNARRLRELSAALVERLAAEWSPAPPDPLAASPTQPSARQRPPRAIAETLEGYLVEESELAVLQHELAFGSRRMFHVAFRGPERAERALFSTLIALDAEGRPYETEIVGDLEMLRFRGDELQEARVFELSRQGTISLHEVDALTQVPGLGANQPIFGFDSPQPLADLPCMPCHDDASLMSLPSERYPVGHRRAGVLARAAANAPVRR